MPGTVICVLAVLALIVTVFSIPENPRVKLWVAVFLLCVIELLRCLPVGK